MTITIDNNLKEKLPNYNPIGYIIEFNDDYFVNEKSIEVSNLINNISSKLKENYNYEEITTISKLKETRDAYKTLGKDPSHTKPACESLIRRILKGNDLYRLGDVIDLGNVLSIETMRSVCVVDLDKVVGNVNITYSTSEINYEGIGRGLINAKNLITYKDDLGIFGSPTSDTLRTMVTNNTHKILIMIMCFSCLDKEQDEQLLLELYNKYTKIKRIEKIN